MAAKSRLDVALVERGLAETRAAAQRLVMAGLVFSGEKRLEKAGQTVAAETALEVRGTATHQLRRGKSERGLNVEYVALCEHLGVAPRTIAVKCPNQNGDVESAQGHLKRRLKQHLLLRRSRDFASAAEYAAFVAGVCTGINALRAAKIAEATPRTGRGCWAGRRRRSRRRASAGPAPGRRAAPRWWRA